MLVDQIKKETVLKESIRMLKSERSNIERHKLIRGGIKLVIDEINERINNNL